MGGERIGSVFFRVAVSWREPVGRAERGGDGAPVGVVLLVLGGRDVPERFMQAGVVEPADVLDDGELELRPATPDAGGDQLGLEAVDERFCSQS